MSLDFSTLVYLPAQDMFSRPVVFSSLAGATTNARGIYTTRAIAIPAEDGSLISDQETILDIRESEFAVLPRQRDRLFIGRDGNVPEAGHFEIVDAKSNGGGETTLVIRSLGPARP